MHNLRRTCHFNSNHYCRRRPRQAQHRPYRERSCDHDRCAKDERSGSAQRLQRQGAGASWDAGYAVTRELSSHASALLKSWEGLRLTAYQDTGGVLTIGYGHTGPEVSEGLTCTQAQADTWFEQDIAWARKAVEEWVTEPLSDNQFGALVAFTYNVGAHAFSNSTVLKVANGSSTVKMRDALLMWVNVHGKPVQGLVNRRNHEADLWEEA